MDPFPLAASWKQLPDELRRLLETGAGSFASTATAFLDAIPNQEQYFARACEILNTINAVSKTANDLRIVTEKTIGFRLNAAFTLYWLYREYNIHVNPFVSHFVEVCQNESRPSGGLRDAEKLRKARFKLIMGILGGEGGKIGDYSAKEFFNGFEQLRVGDSTDLKSFAHALKDDEEFPISVWNTNAAPQKITNGWNALGKQAGYTQSYANAGQNPKDIATAVDRALADAPIRPLTAQDKSTVLNNIRYAAKVYKATDPEAFKRMLDVNFDLILPLTVEILKQTGNPARSNMLNNILPTLNLELRSFDTINKLIMRPAKDSGGINNSSRDLKGITPGGGGGGAEDSTPILTSAERTHFLHIFISNCIRHLEAPYGELDDMPVPIRRSAKSPDAARKVRLLCMFITNLLTKDITTGQELYYEIQDLYMAFITNKDAKELWRNVNGGAGVLNG